MALDWTTITVKGLYYNPKTDGSDPPILAFCSKLTKKEARSMKDGRSKCRYIPVAYGVSRGKRAALNMAKNYARSRAYSKAIELAEGVISKHPDSKEAQEARKLLAEWKKASAGQTKRSE